MSAPALDFAVVSAAAAHADSSISRAQAKPEWIATEFSLMISLAASRHYVDAAVDKQRFAREATRIRGREVRAREADVHDVDQLANRRFARRLGEQQIEVFEPARGARLERPRRNRVHPDLFGAELKREV